MTWTTTTWSPGSRSKLSVCLAAGHGAKGAPQPAASASHDCRCGRVAQTHLRVALCDRGAVAVEGAVAESVLGALGETGTHGSSSGGNGTSPRRWHKVSPLR